VRVTDENFFRAMNVPVLSGRTFTEQEATENRRVAVISQSLARKYFPGEDPLGKRITVDMKDEPEPTEIIGVVGDTKHQALDAGTKPTVYWPHPQLPYTAMTLVARTAGDPVSIANAAQREIQAIDKDQPVSDVRTMQSWLAESVARSRFGATLLAIFAGVALILAGVGLYGVMAYSVAQRRHEVGIRLALGAQTSDIFKLIVRQGMLLTVIGVATGLAAAWALTRVMSSLLYEVSTTDPFIYAGLALVLTVVALIACLIPAWRAMRTEPIIALRHE